MTGTQADKIRNFDLKNLSLKHVHAILDLNQQLINMQPYIPVQQQTAI